MEHAKFAGHRWVDQDDKNKVALYHTVAVTKGTPYSKVYRYSATASNGEEAIVPLEEETVHDLCKIVVALEDSAATKISIFQESGNVEEAYVGDGVAVGDYLEVVAAGTYFVPDGTTGSTTRTDQSAAVALEANASGATALKKILLLRETHDIAAS
jgi:hypothetical protein